MRLPLLWVTLKSSIRSAWQKLSLLSWHMNWQGTGLVLQLVPFQLWFATSYNIQMVSIPLASLDCRNTVLLALSETIRNANRSQPLALIVAVACRQPLDFDWYDPYVKRIPTYSKGLQPKHAETSGKSKPITGWHPLYASLCSLAKLPTRPPKWKKCWAELSIPHWIAAHGGWDCNFFWAMNKKNLCRCWCRHHIYGPWYAWISMQRVLGCIGWNRKWQRVIALSKRPEGQTLKRIIIIL